MRLSRFSLLAVAALTTIGCQRDDGSLQPTSLPPLAYVRYINALPDTLGTTVRFIDQVEFSPQTWAGVPFRGMGLGSYQGTQAGNRQFRVFTYYSNNDLLNIQPENIAGNTVVLGEASHNFEAGKYYTVIFTGFARAGGSPAKEIRIMEDDVPTPGSSIAVRAIHAAAGVGNVDVYLTPTATSPISGAPAFAGLAFGTSSSYSTVTPGAFAARVAPAGSTTPIISTAAPAGVAGTTLVDPMPGATIPGTVLSIVVFSASVPGSPAATSANPTVAFFTDRRPPRTSPF